MEPHADPKAGEVYRSILSSLFARSDHSRPRADFPRFNAVLNLALGIAVFAALIFGASFGAAALGWNIKVARYFANIALLIFFVSNIIVTCALLAHLPNVFRLSRFWLSQTSTLVADCLLVEQLANYSPTNLETLKQMLVLRRDTFRNRQEFVLGRATKISPFLVVLSFVLITSAGDQAKIVELSTPWIAQLLTSPAGWINACILIVGFVFARFRDLEIDETHCVYIGLVGTAHQHSTSRQTATANDFPATAPSSESSPQPHETYETANSTELGVNDPVVQAVLRQAQDGGKNTSAPDSVAERSRSRTCPDAASRPVDANEISSC